MSSMAEVLYEHWKSHSYELQRQPEFKDAPPNLRATFERQEAALTEAGYRQMFDGDCGLGGVQGDDYREAAEAWMRWANLVGFGDSGLDGIAAMRQMLAEFGYERRSGK